MLSGMDARRARHRLPLAGAAVAGAAVAHALLYLVKVPDTRARDAVLAATGHAYWSVAVAAAIVLGLGAACSIAARRFRHGLDRAGGRAAPDRVDRLALRLALYQSAIFVVQEGVERLAAGDAPVDLVATASLLLTGIAVQVLVALAVAAALAGLGRAAEAVGRALRPAPPPESGAAPLRWPSRRARRSRLLGGPAAIRAPPRLQRG
jgi:hypothetical protein